MRDDTNLVIWLTDAAQWWCDGARETLSKQGHKVRVFETVELLLTAGAFENTAPDVVVFGCGTASEAAMKTIVRLAETSWTIVVAPGGVDVSSICTIFATGVAGIAERYGTPASLVQAVESADRTSRRVRSRRPVWSQPA